MDKPGKRNAAPSGDDGDRIRITEHGPRASRAGLIYLALALVLVGCLVGYLIAMVGPRSPSVAADSNTDANTVDGRADANARADAATATTTTHSRELEAQRAESLRDPNDLANFVTPGQPAPTMGEVIDRLHEAGVHTGLGAFPKPGTSPPLIGLAVPDDYALPQGYVRHFQATDDGQRIEPILMFSPDFEFFDSAGNRIEIPRDRVVPPNMAPPGLVIRRIAIPPPINPGSPPV